MLLAIFAWGCAQVEPSELRDLVHEVIDPVGLTWRGSVPAFPFLEIS